MAIRVQLPDGRIVEMPDGTPPELIEKAAQKLMQPAQPTLEQRFDENLKNTQEQRFNPLPTWLNPAPAIADFLVNTGKEFAFHPVKNAPAIGAMAATGAAPFTGGASLLGLTALAGGGALVGAGAREGYDQLTDSPDASQSFGDAAQRAGGDALQEAILQGGFGAAGRGVSAMAPFLKKQARNAYSAAVGLTKSHLNKQPGASYRGLMEIKDQLADAGLEMGRTNRGMRPSSRGLHNMEDAIDAIEATKATKLSEADAAGISINPTEVDAPAMARAEPRFRNQLVNQDDLAAIEDTLSKYKTNPELGQMVGTGDDAVWERSTSELPSKMHEFVRNSSTNLRDKYGKLQPASVEAEKGLVGAARQQLGDAVPGYRELNRTEKPLLDIRDALRSKLLGEEIAPLPIPPAWAAAVHPMTTAAHSVAKLPGLMTRFESGLAFGLDNAARKAPGVGSLLQNVAPNVLRGMTPEHVEPEDELEALFQRYQKSRGQRF